MDPTSLIQIGDTISKFGNPYELWGTVVSDEGSIFRLSSGRSIKKSTYNIIWTVSKSAFKQEQYRIFKDNKKKEQEKKTLSVFSKVANTNTMVSVIITPLTEYYLYRVYWINDGTFDPDPYNMDAVWEKIVNARNSQEATQIAATGKLGMNTKHFWENPRYLVCQLLGQSFINETKIITESSQTTGD